MSVIEDRGWRWTAGLILSGGILFGSPQSQKIEIRPLTPIKKVLPVYPDYLKDEGIAGEVACWAIIDNRGNVKNAAVFRSLHPELDKLALEAMRQWKYEPYVYGGKPIPVPTFISVVYSPGDSSLLERKNETRPEAEEFGVEESHSDELRTILERCSEYGRKLFGAALFYVCRETIKETVTNVVERETTFVWTTIEDALVASAAYTFPALEGSARKTFVNEYQLVNINGKVGEQRIPPGDREKESGGMPVSWGAMLISSLKPVLFPSRLFGLEQRGLLSFRIIGEERIRKQSVYIIEIKPKTRRGVEIRSGKIWVGRESGQVLKAEVDYASPAYNRQILEECRRYHLTPHVTAMYEYEIEKNGILFPSRSRIDIEYSGLVRPPKDTKAIMDIRYDKYRFFTVETDSKIIR
jgi:protein TonB